MEVKSIDHIVLTTYGIDKTVYFYSNILGMTLEVFAEGRKALIFGK